MDNRIISENFFNPACETESEGTGDLMQRNNSESTFGSCVDLASQMQHYKNVREASFKIGKPLDEKMLQKAFPEDFDWKSTGSSTEVSVDFAKNTNTNTKKKKVVSEESLYFDYAVSDSESCADRESFYRLDSDSSFFKSAGKLGQDVRQASFKTGKPLDKEMVQTPVEEEKQMDPLLDNKELVNEIHARKTIRGSLRKNFNGFHSILAELNIPNIRDSNPLIKNETQSKDVQINEDVTTKSEELCISSTLKIDEEGQIPLSSSQRRSHAIYIDDNLARQEYIRMLEQEVIGLKLKLADAQGSLDVVKLSERERIEEVETMKLELKNLHNQKSDQAKTSVTPEIESTHEIERKNNNISEQETRSTLWFSGRPKSLWRQT